MGEPAAPEHVANGHLSGGRPLGEHRETEAARRRAVERANALLRAGPNTKLLAVGSPRAAWQETCRRAGGRTSSAANCRLSSRTRQSFQLHSAMLKPGGSWSKSGGSGGSSRAAGGPQPNWANSCSASCRYCWTSAVRGDAPGPSVTRGARLATPCVVAPSVSGARGAADGAAATAGAADSAGRVGVCIVSARGGASASSRPEGGVSSLALGEPAATAPEPCISTRLRRLRRGGSGPTGRLLMSIRYCISHEGRSRMGKPSRAATTAWSSAVVGGRASLANTLRRRLPSLLVSARGVLRRASGRGMVASRWCWACGLGSDAAPGTEDGRAGGAVSSLTGVKSERVASRQARPTVVGETSSTGYYPRLWILSISRPLASASRALPLSLIAETRLLDHSISLASIWRAFSRPRGTQRLSAGPTDPRQRKV